MKCRDAQSQLSALSAEDLPTQTIIALREHLSQCPQCKEEWIVFEQTLLILSTTPQPILSREVSEQIWQHCSRQLHDRIEQQRVQRRSNQISNPFLWGWALRQPRWGWAAVGSALAILGSVWFFAPHNESIEQGPAITLTDFDSPGDLFVFQRPPAAASSLVNYHSAMSFDPFTDHVGSTLVSHSATSPSP